MCNPCLMFPAWPWDFPQFLLLCLCPTPTGTSWSRCTNSCTCTLCLKGPRLRMGWLLAEWFGTECRLLAGAWGKGYFEYLMLRLTRFHVHDFCEARSCSFVSPVLPQSPNKWSENCADLEKLFSQMLSLSQQGSFIHNPEWDREKDSLGWWGVETDLCGVCSFLRERYKIAVFYLLYV